MQRKNGLAHVLTGDGNGKTTSAVGIAVRAAGRGLRVAFVQFLKGGLSGELAPLAKLGVTVVSRTKYCPKGAEHERMLEEKGYAVFCKGCFEICKEDRQLVREAFEKAGEFCASGEYDVVVLDEIFLAIIEKLITEKEVLDLISKKAQKCELILTGRGATPKIEEIADYVSYVGKIKHPFDSGTLARAGVDY